MLVSSNLEPLSFFHFCNELSYVLNTVLHIFSGFKQERPRFLKEGISVFTLRLRIIHKHTLRVCCGPQTLVKILIGGQSITFTTSCYSIQFNLVNFVRSDTRNCTPCHCIGKDSSFPRWTLLLRVHIPLKALSRIHPNYIQKVQLRIVHKIRLVKHTTKRMEPPNK